MPRPADDPRRRRLTIVGLVASSVALIALLTTLLTVGGQAQPGPLPHVALPTLPAVSPSAQSATSGGGLGDPSHLVRLEIVSGGPAYVLLGWKSPTSVPNEGKTSYYGSTWSHTVTATGGGPYATLYAEYAKAVAPVTCRIYVDGHLAVQHTSSGAYSAVFCGA